MQKNTCSGERLSFARPNAESTMNATFQWGRKDFNNSSISQDKSAKSPQKTLNLSKIDSRVYTDVQSRGLASRIVKYHENGTRFNRSISLTNLCGKTSPLSIKKLEAKPQLKYDKAIKQNVSMTHIAPPEKSLFYGNTLSGLLRSSSVINLKQNEDNLSSENRPIIHPPVTEKEMQPTRSVLEELKEISRKRINNEVLQDNDDTVDTSKKYCGRILDTSAHFTISNDYRSQQIHAQTQLPPASVYKRQRESAVDGYVPSFMNANSFQPKPHHTDQLASPEQQSKRRHCNYNNDITSSLSSSAKNTTSSKRKLFEHDGYKRQEKLLRYQSDIRLPEMSAALNYGNQFPITPLPNTPQTNSSEIPLPSGALVQKSASAPLPATADSTRHSEVGSSGAVKPKLTLFNRDYETKAVDLEPNEEKEDSNEDDNAYSGINFVKPKKSANNIGSNSASNLVMQRTRKSKLALMLSGLRGELYLGDEEEEQRVKGITSSKVNDEKQKNAEQQQQPTTLMPIAMPTNVTNSLHNQQNTNLTDKPDASEKVAPVTMPPNDNLGTTISKPSADSTLTQPPKITSPLTGIKLTPIIKTPTTNAQALPTLNFAAPTSATANDAAINRNFSLGAPVSSLTKVTPAVTTTTASFSFGAPSSITATKTTPILPFTTTTNATTAATNTATGSAACPSFSLNLASASAPTAVHTISTPAGLNFAINAPVGSASSLSTKTPAASITTFGDSAAIQNSQQNSSTTVPAATTNSTVSMKPTATAGFNFTNKPTDAAFTFGSNTTVTAAQQNEVSKMFSFSATPKAANPTASGSFAFGSNSNPNPLDNKTAQTTSPFGSATSQPTFDAKPADQSKTPTSTNSFMFGGVKPAIQTATTIQPTFGVATTQNKESKNTPDNNFLFASGGGGINSTALQHAAKPIFGSANNESNSGGLFGFKTVNNSTNNTATTTTNENSTPSNSFSFANAPTSAQPKAAFNFGVAGSVTNTNSDSSQSSANLFGTALGTNQQTKTFSFGSQNVAASTTSTEPAKAVNTFNFSSVNQNNKNAFLFATGNSSNDATINKSSNCNTFDVAVVNSNKSSGGGFNFNQTSGVGIFNFNAAQKSTNDSNNVSNNQTTSKPNTTTNSFGSFSSNNQSSTGGGGFVFGASKSATPSFTATPTTNAPNASLVFGATQQQNSTTASAVNNLFATPTASTQPGNLFTAATNATSNIFGSTSNATPVFGTTPAALNSGNNVFAVPATSGSDRPIRRATRRLAKP